MRLHIAAFAASGRFFGVVSAVETRTQVCSVSAFDSANVPILQFISALPCLQFFIQSELILCHLAASILVDKLLGEVDFCKTVECIALSVSRPSDAPKQCLFQDILITV